MWPIWIAVQKCINIYCRCVFFSDIGTFWISGNSHGSGLQDNGCPNKASVGWMAPLLSHRHQVLKLWSREWRSSSASCCWSCGGRRENALPHVLRAGYGHGWSGGVSVISRSPGRCISNRHGSGRNEDRRTSAIIRCRRDTSVFTLSTVHYRA